MNSQTPFSAPISPSIQAAGDRYLVDSERNPSGDVFEALKQIKKRLPLVLSCIVVGAALAIVVALFLMPHYTAKSLILVNDNDPSDPRRADEGAIDMHISLLSSQAHLDRVLAETRKDPELRDRFARTSDIERRLKVMQELRSRLIGINFTAKSPEVAAKVANDVARLYVEETLSAGDADAQQLARGLSRQLAELEGRLQLAQTEARSLDSVPDAEPAARESANQRIDYLRQQISEAKLRRGLAQRQEESRKQNLALAPAIQVYALAQPPEQPSSIKPIYVIIPAVMASALFGIALALLRARLDRRIHDVAGLRRAFSIPCLGAAPPKPKESLGSGPDGMFMDEYDQAMEMIAASVFMVASGGRRSVVVVANVDATSGSDFVYDFAISASRMKRTLLVYLFDAVDGMPHIPQKKAASTDKHAPCNLTYTSLARDRTSFLALAASGALAATLKNLRFDYDWILIAAPSVAGSPVAPVIAEMADQIILTIKAGSTSYDDVTKALRALAPAEEWERSTLPTRMAFVMTNLPNEQRKGRQKRTSRRESSRSTGRPLRKADGDLSISLPQKADEMKSPIKKDAFIAGATK